jgi:hypothetical protein
MNDVYVIRNQSGAYLSKAREWLHEREPRQLARFRHRDEAVNTLVELSAKDVALRGEVVAVPLGERGEPALPAEAVDAA